MKYPRLVPCFLCKTPIRVMIYSDEISDQGEPIKVFDEHLFCNFQDGAKTILNDQKKIVEISGAAYFDGDICPDLPIISGGEVDVFGVKRRILRGVKGRNPDGTVNYTKLELI